MYVRNVHERFLTTPVEQAGFLIDSLGTAEDLLWPRNRWPVIRLDAPLREAKFGSHGPVAYAVEHYLPGRSVEFRFTHPPGFDGTHRFELEPGPGGEGSRLRHVLEMRVHGPALLSWPLLFRPLHNALLEDALDCAERATGIEPGHRRWSTWVQLLRGLLRSRQ